MLVTNINLFVNNKTKSLFYIIFSNIFVGKIC